MYWEVPGKHWQINEQRADKWDRDKKLYEQWHRQLNNEDEDDDGFRVIPPLPIDRPMKRTGIKCGQCGMKFEDGKPYLYSCSERRCPIFPQITY